MVGEGRVGIRGERGGGAVHRRGFRRGEATRLLGGCPVLRAVDIVAICAALRLAPSLFIPSRRVSHYVGREDMLLSSILPSL